MSQLLDDALTRFGEIVARHDRDEILRLALRLAPPTMRMLRRDQRLAQTTTDVEKFEKAFEGAGDADICRAILADRVEAMCDHARRESQGCPEGCFTTPEPSDVGGES
jgi:hypothetical protein